MAEALGGQPYCGSVALKKGKARLSASRSEDLIGLRSRFEAIGGSLVRFERELVRDLAKSKAFADSRSAEGLVPPRLLEGAGPVRMMSTRVENAADPEVRAATAKNFLDNYYKALLDSGALRSGGTGTGRGFD